MHDPKFEKEVQQKMEELSFHPSETVWKNVERGIRTDKKRRPAVLWLFVLAGIMLAGGYYIISSSPRAADEKSLAVGDRGIKHGGMENAGTENRGGENAGVENKGTESKGVQQTTAENGEAENKAAADKNAVEKVAGNERTENTAAKSPGLTARAADEYRSPRGTKPAANKKTFGEHTEIFRGKEERKEQNGEREAEAQRTEKERAKGLEWKPAVLPSLVVMNGLSGAEKALPPRGAAARNTPAKAVAAVNHLKPVHPWKLGFTGGAGISTVQNSLLHRATVAQQADVASRFAAYPSALQKHPSTIRDGFAYQAGLFVQRSFRRRLSFSLGMTYHYYSTEVKTGPLNVAQSYNVSNALTNQQQPGAVSTQAFAVGDVGTRHNHYQLLEFPLAMQWEMIPSRKVPVYWEAGLSFSALLDANALYFDGSSGTYYKDNAVFNKSQTILSSAFLFGIPVFGQRLQAGPQVQYGLTDLLKNNSDQGQHLLYGGIKINVLLGSWK